MEKVWATNMAVNRIVSYSLPCGLPKLYEDVISKILTDLLRVKIEDLGSHCAGDSYKSTRIHSTSCLTNIKCKTMSCKDLSKLIFNTHAM